MPQKVRQKDILVSQASKASEQSVVAGLIGRGIQLSRTPAMHEAEGSAHGLRLVYQLIDADMLKNPDISFSDILQAAETMGFSGLNITFPFKKEAIPYLDKLSDAAQAIGAVNTIILKDGVRSGHNTDYWGFSESFRRGMAGADLGCALLIGAGGAGCAVANALLDQGVQHLQILDVNQNSAQDLTQKLKMRSDAKIEAVTDIEVAAKRANGIVNATPIGMAKLPGCPIPIGLISPDHWVADIIYFPLETELLKAAKRLGCRTLQGSGMAIFQAFRAFELFTGLEPDYQRMKATFNAFNE